MAAYSTTLREPLRPQDAAVARDMRRHRRLPLSLAGRFMRADRNEFNCQLENISVGGAAVVSPHAPEIGERVIAYFDHLGGVEGVVARHTPDGFAFSFTESIWLVGGVGVLGVLGLTCCGGIAGVGVGWDSVSVAISSKGYG